MVMYFKWYGVAAVWSCSTSDVWACICGLFSCAGTPLLPTKVATIVLQQRAMFISNLAK